MMYDQRLISLAIVGIVTFVGDSPRGILFPALWPLCSRLGGSKIDLGLLVATFSVGRLVMSTPLGIMSDRWRHRFALLLSTAILVAGAILWANVQFLGGLPMLYVAQFTLGLGTGSLGVTRSYVAEQATPKERTVMLARLSALQYAGFAATPLLGSALVVAGRNISSFWEYALPAYLVLLFALVTWALLYGTFVDFDENDDTLFISEEEQLARTQIDAAQKETPSDGHKRGYQLRTNDNSIRRNEEEEGIELTSLNSRSRSASTNSTTYDFSSSVLTNPLIPTTFMLTTVTNKASTTHAVQSTSTTSTSDDIIDTTKPTNNIIDLESVLMSSSPSSQNTSSRRNSLTNNNIVNEHTIAYDHVKNIVFYVMIFQNFTTRGCIAIYETQMSSIFLDNYNQPEIVLGLTVSFAGLLGTIQMVYYKQLYTDHFSNLTLMLGGIMIMSFANVFVINWIPNIPQQLWRALIALYFMYSIGYPVGNSAILGSFSSLQKTGRQATAQSNFALMGSFARIVFPILAGVMESYVGSYSSFSVTLFFSSISVVCIAFLAQAIVYCTTVDRTESNRRILSTLLNSKFFKLHQWMWIELNLFCAILALVTIINQVRT